MRRVNIPDAETFRDKVVPIIKGTEASVKMQSMARMWVSEERKGRKDAFDAWIELGKKAVLWRTKAHVPTEVCELKLKPARELVKALTGDEA